MTIIKKEFARFFGDKRMVLTTLLLPGLMIYVVYSFMGDGLMNQIATDEDYQYKVQATDVPDYLKDSMEAMNFKLIETDGKDAQQAQEKVEVQDMDLYVAFPADFDTAVSGYDTTSGTLAPNVEVYYNSASVESQTAYSMMYELLDGYESSLANKFDVNNTEAKYDLATEEDTTGKIFSMMLPMLLMVFIYSGCVAIAPESIAGEKERGTIATLLVTPMKRSQLAMGKIISLSVIGLLSGCSSFIGVMLSLPKLMGGASEGMNASVYKISDYVMLLLVVLATVLVLISVISIISALSKSVKEASTAVAPLMILVMLVGITSMMGNGAPAEMVWYFIPLYNSAQCMNAIFSFSGDMTNIIITVVSNLVYSAVMAGILTKLFDSEKIMYI